MSLAETGGGPDRTSELMMRALDEEISEADTAELNDLIMSDESLLIEWERLKQVKAKTAGIELKKPPDELWEGYMDSVYRRVERGIGWILLSVGAIVLFSYVLWQVIRELIGDVTIPWYVKGGVFALLVGIVILAVSVIREKYFVFKDDPYRDVHR
jgi:hypothetical protein